MPQADRQHRKGVALIIAGPSGLASLIATLETPLMPFWVWLAFQEVPSIRALVGGALVMGAVIFEITAENRARGAQVRPMEP